MIQRTAAPHAASDIRAVRRDIHFIDTGGDSSPAAEPVVVTYVDGPYAGRREVIYGRVPPAAVIIPAEHGVYRRSVRCVDDHALRYVWSDSERRPGEL